MNDLFDFKRSREKFGLADYEAYRKKTAILEELEYIFGPYGIKQDYTSGLEQLARNLAFVAIPLLLLYTDQMAKALPAGGAFAPVLLFAIGILASWALIKYSSHIRFYRGSLYLSAIVELARFLTMEEICDAIQIEDDKKVLCQDEGEKNFYRAVHQMLNIPSSSRGDNVPKISSE